MIYIAVLIAFNMFTMLELSDREDNELLRWLYIAIAVLNLIGLALTILHGAFPTLQTEGYGILFE